MPPLEQHERLLLEQSDTFTYQLHSHQLSYTTLHQSRDWVDSIFVFHMFMSVRVSCVADSGSRNRAQSERLMQVNEENVQKLKTRRARLGMQNQRAIRLNTLTGGVNDTDLHPGTC